MYDGFNGVKDHILKLFSYYQKLKAIKIDLNEDYLTWCITKCFPSQFDSIKSSYNTQRVEWSLDEMTAILVKEEDDINRNKSNVVALAMQKGDKPKKFFLKKIQNKVFQEE